MSKQKQPPPPPPPDIEEEDEGDDDFLDVIDDRINEVEKRVERVDRTLYFGLRGIVMLIDHLEQAINPMSEPEAKAASLIKVREIIDMMRENIK